MRAGSPIFAVFCLLGLLFSAAGARAEQHVKLGLDARDETITLSLPDGWRLVSDARFAQLAQLPAAMKAGPGSRLIQAWEQIAADGARSAFLITSMPTGKFPEAQLVEYERAPELTLQAMRYDRALNVVWTPAQVTRRGASTLTAIIPTEQGAILLQAVGDPIPGLTPLFERVVSSAQVSDALRYRHPGRTAAAGEAPAGAASSHWGTLVGIVVACLLVSLWSHFAATLPRGWPRAARQLLVLLVAFLALGLLTHQSAQQSADAGVAFGYALAPLLGLSALGARIRRRPETVRSDTC